MDLRREWNQQGLDGPFPEAEDWVYEPESAADSWTSAEIPVTDRHLDLINGGSYYLESAGNWVRHLTTQIPTCHLKALPVLIRLALLNYLMRRTHLCEKMSASSRNVSVYDLVLAQMWPEFGSCQFLHFQ